MMDYSQCPGRQHQHQGADAAGRWVQERLGLLGEAV